MFVMGIDPGLSRCGYGGVRQERGHPQVVCAGVLSTPVDDPVPDRLSSLLRQLQSLLGRSRPDFVVVERVLFQVNARTAMAVGQASGLALACASELGIPVAQYSPNEVKQSVTGWGNAGKDQVQRMVQALLDLPGKPSPPDMADALALALCHLGGASLARAVARSQSSRARLREQPIPATPVPGGPVRSCAGALGALQTDGRAGSPRMVCR